MSVKSLTKNVFYTLGLCLWVVFALSTGQTIAALLVGVITADESAATLTGLAALGYVFGLALAVAIPYLVWRKRASNETLGVSKRFMWSDIGLGISSVLPYYLLSAVLVWAGINVLNVIDPTVTQQIGFSDLASNIEFALAFITLVLMAPIAEELLFRGYFLGRLNERIGKWLAVVVSAAVFGALHLVGAGEGGIVLQVGAATDTFALGLIAGTLRLVTGSIWAGVVLHAIKNAIAYYFLFIHPLLTGGM